MKLRNAFFLGKSGFSLLGTLVAVVIGGALAAVIATVVSDAVEGQRVILERDEMSDFSQFVKGLLSSDSLCNTALRDQHFLVKDKTDLVLAVPFQDLKGPIEKAFTFGRDKLVVNELTIEDVGDAPVPMNINLAGSGTVLLNRHTARVKLMIGQVGGTVSRTRYFELPILVDPSTGKIKSCNNDFSIADACLALGFEWDTKSSPAVCKPKNACMAGGIYKVISGGLFSPGGCGIANPATGKCSCPPGFTDMIAGAADLVAACGRLCFLSYNLIHQCLRCP